MKINNKLRLQLLIQSWVFVVFFLIAVGLIGYITSEYRYSKDITQANRSKLTEGSIEVLKQLKNPVDITVYATEDDPTRGDIFRKRMRSFVERYQREKKDINLSFVNPTEEPKLVQENNIKQDGELIVEYNKRQEHMYPPVVEQDLTNVLVRLSRTNSQPIMFLDGHGERNLFGKKAEDLGEFGKVLESKGFTFVNTNLMIAQDVPSNGSMLVVAAPKVKLNEVEVAKIKKYIESGGHLLWLLDDGDLQGLDEVADYLGVTVSDAIVMDMAAQEYRLDPRNAFSVAYGDHPITKTFQYLTVYPDAHEVDAKASYEFGWKVSRLVDVAQKGWLEFEKIVPGVKNQKVKFDEGVDKPGPINIGVALERDYGKKGQRVVVMGNANFLSNTFITNQRNLDFGVNIVNWLAGDDNLITIQPSLLKDINFVIPDKGWGNIWAMIIWNPVDIGFWTKDGVIFPFGLFNFIIPVLVMFFGFYFWHKRRKA